MQYIVYIHFITSYKKLQILTKKNNERVEKTYQALHWATWWLACCYWNDLATWEPCGCFPYIDVKFQTKESGFFRKKSILEALKTVAFLPVERLKNCVLFSFFPDCGERLLLLLAAPGWRTSSNLGSCWLEASKKVYQNPIVSQNIKAASRCKKEFWKPHKIWDLTKKLTRQAAAHWQTFEPPPLEFLRIAPGQLALSGSSKVHGYACSLLYFHWFPMHVVLHVNVLR